MNDAGLRILIGVCLFLAPATGQGKAWARPAASAYTDSNLTETYVRVKRRADKNQSAVLTLTPMRGRRIMFHLTALWWPVGREDSPHNGEIEAVVAFRKHRAVYQDASYCLTMQFRDQTAVLTERGANPAFGAFVSASGIYRRSHQPTKQSKAQR